MYHFNIFSILTLLASEAYLLMSLYILSKNPKAASNRLFLFVALSMAIWGLGEGMMRASIESKYAFFWGCYIMGIGSSLHPAALMHFWLTFSGQLFTLRKKIPVLILYIPSLIFISVRLFRSDLLISGVAKQYWGYSIVGSQLYFLYLLFVPAYTMGVIYLIFKKSFTSYGPLRKQCLYIGCGILFSVFLGIATQSIRPFVHMEIPELTVISTLVFISFIAYAVVRFGLLAITPGMAADEIIETMADNLIVADRNGNIAFANNAALQVLGKKASEVSSKPIRNVSIQLEKIINELENKNVLRDFEMDLANEDTSAVPLSINVSKMKDKRDNVIGYVFAMRDISHIKELIKKLSNSNIQLQEALENIKTLSGIIPICSVCHNIRNDKGYWQQVEQYVSQHSDAQFSHSICPSCLKKNIRILQKN